MSGTLIVLNPHAASGRSRPIWAQIEPTLREHLQGDVVVAITERPADVPAHVAAAYASGLRQVISIGGDGTNHALVNALADWRHRHPDAEPIVYGNLPIGTGRDWARMLGVPFEPRAAIRWLMSARPRAVDVGQLAYEGRREYFLNIASAGLGGEVGVRTYRARKRPWTFFTATLSSIFTYQPPRISVHIDGEHWYTGTSFIVAVANGTTFGRGMHIAPDARIDDGLLDVVLVRGMSKLNAVMRLPKVYTGRHVKDPYVSIHRARYVEIVSEEGPLTLELDGELANAGARLRFEIQPALLSLLRH